MKLPAQPARRDIVAEYARLAPSYDERWAFYIEGTTRETLARLTLKPGDQLLDVGCGTGALLHRLSRSHPAELLTGLDPVPEMLAVARGRLPPEVGLRDGRSGSPSATRSSMSSSPATCFTTFRSRPWP
jgi:ubiquinone/menaquinone biosynthesis C-methylase UbiE